MITSCRSEFQSTHESYHVEQETQIGQRKIVHVQSHLTKSMIIVLWRVKATWVGSLGGWSHTKLYRQICRSVQYTKFTRTS